MVVSNIELVPHIIHIFMTVTHYLDMYRSHCPHRLLIISVWMFLLWLTSCASSQHQVGHEPLFPTPEILQPNVEFWKKVYAVWDNNQYAVHDDLFMNLVYEVITLPGSVSSSLTSEQRQMIRARRSYWQRQLQALHQAQIANKPLSTQLKQLRSQLAAVGITNRFNEAVDRVRLQRGLRSRFRRGLEISGRYDEALRVVFRRYKLPEQLVYLPHVESSFQVHARSSAGATGIWQFIRSTGEAYLTINDAIDERLDPILAADGAARYLRDAYAQLHHWPVALTAYNHGVNGMRRAGQLFNFDIGRIVKNYQSPSFGFASRNFYAEFLAASAIAERPNVYFKTVRYEPPLEIRSIVLSERIAPHLLAQQHGLSTADLIALNPAWLNPWRDTYQIPAGTTVWLPITKG
jgi:membrane-bound lytic murein transglycosylase D